MGFASLGVSPLSPLGKPLLILQDQLQGHLLSDTVIDLSQRVDTFFLVPGTILPWSPIAWYYHAIHISPHQKSSHSKTISYLPLYS